MFVTRYISSDLTDTISVNQLYLAAGSLSKDCADLSFKAGVETCSVLSFYNINRRPVERRILAGRSNLISGQISLR